MFQWRLSTFRASRRNNHQLCPLAIERLEDRLVPSGDMVLRWNDVLLDAIRAHQTPPPLAARNMAIVHVAVYDAVNSIYQTHQPYAVMHPGMADASPEAAVAAAAHRTLSQLFPAQQPTFAAALTDSLAEIPDGPTKLDFCTFWRPVLPRQAAVHVFKGF
jgi:hypothetical protein